MMNMQVKKPHKKNYPKKIKKHCIRVRNKFIRFARKTGLTPKVFKNYGPFRMITSWFRVYPDFIIVGASKAGTTSMFDSLLQNPDILPILKKEPYFFNANYEKGLWFYRTVFPTIFEKWWHKIRRNKHAVVGEATTKYFEHPLVPARIKKHLPNVKLIVMLRNPVDRTYSDYNMIIRHRKESESFENALKLERKRISDDLKTIVNHDPLRRGNNLINYGYVWESAYYLHMLNFLKYFPMHQIMVIRSEDFFEDQAKVIKQVCDFIGVERYDYASPITSNVSKYDPINEQTRKRLKQYFKPLNKKLYELIGRDMGWD